MERTSGRYGTMAFWLISIFYLVLFWLVKELPFFWDNIFLSSKTAHHFLDNGLSALILPAEWDGGHPPFWGTYIATGWKILGRELWVGHLMMLPFLIGIGWQIYRLSEWLLGEKYKWLGLALGILEPTVLAQSTMVGPEIALLFSFLLGLNAILRKNYLWLFPATVLLVIFNTRGVILCMLLFIILLIVLKHRKEKFRFKYIEYFISAALIYGIWLWYHWEQTGYLLGHPDSSWAAHRGISSFGIIMKKMVIQIWYALDFGRIMLWLTGAFAMFKLWKEKSNIKETQKLWIKITVVSFLFYSIFLCTISNPILHRYSMFLYLMIGLFFISLIIALRQKIYIYLCIGLIALSFLAGQFMYYPNHMATGWDANLKHLDYFPVREQMLSYIDSEEIPYESIATGFPNKDGRFYSDLTSELLPFSSYGEEASYLLYSNVMNDLKRPEILERMEGMDVVKRIEKDGVFIELLSVKK